MLTGYPLSCTLGRSVLGIGSAVARFLIIAEYICYLRILVMCCECNTFAQSTVRFIRKQDVFLKRTF